MDTKPKGEVLDLRPMEIEAVGTGNAVRISVGRTNQVENHFAVGKRNARKRMGSFDPPEIALRGSVAQGLVDRGSGQAGADGTNRRNSFLENQIDPRCKGSQARIPTTDRTGMKETLHTLASVHLNNRRSVWIRPPAQEESATQLVVFLDGELHRDRLGASAAIDDLLAQGEIADSWFVFVSIHSAEARWRECPCYAPFASFIVEEVLPMLERVEPASIAATERTIVGASYSGLAAAFIAAQRPGRFRKVIAQSGSFWSNGAWLTDRIRTLRDPLPTAFYLTVGNRETQRNVRHREDVLQDISQLESVTAFRDALRDRGHKVTYVEHDGFHEFKAWARALPAALQWAVPPSRTRPSPADK